MLKNVGSQNVAAQMNARTDGAPLTTDVSVFYSLNGGDQTPGVGNLSHKGNGHWNYIPHQAETNANHVAFTFTHANGVNQTVNVYPVGIDPHTAIAYQVWSEILTGPTYTTNNSAGKILRLLKSAFAFFDTSVAAVGASTVNLTSGSATVDFYKPGLIIVSSSFGTQFRRIEAYSGTPNRTVTVATPWATLPEVDDEVNIIPWSSVRVSDIDADTATDIATEVHKRGLTTGKFTALK